MLAGDCDSVQAGSSPVFLRDGCAFVVVGHFLIWTLTSEFVRRPSVKNVG
jgi:hypothetical protein